MMKSAEIVVPPLFLCPISLELFKDPVTLSTGQTYDRCCIEKWLSSGNSTCPVTMQKLQDTSVVPNHTLRHLIDQWLRSDNCLDQSNSDLSISAMKRIIGSEHQESTTLENKLRVLEKVHSLSHQLPLKNSCLIESNFFGLLFELVLKNAKGSLKLVEKSLVCVIELMPFSDLAPLNILQEEFKYNTFLSLFENGSVLIKKSLCLVVEAISSSSDTWPLCEKLGKSVKFLQELVRTVGDKSEAVELEAAGVRAISSLSLVESNLGNLVENGAVQGLITYIISSLEKQKKGTLAAMAMSTIENLLSVEIAKEAILGHPCGVKAIVRMVFTFSVSSDDEGSESAVNSLLIICSDSKSAREQVIVCGVLTQLLFLLQSQCSVRSKTKARLLLKLLRSL